MKKKILFIILFALMFLPIINANAITVVDCGNVTDIPKKLPEIVSMVVTIIQIAAPVVLVITGSIDLLKAVSAQKEDEIKKCRQILIKRTIVAFVIFFIVALAKFLVSVAADSSDKENITDCVDCFLSGSCKNERTK